jgi:WhiB family redox-sensing transcriptional regulator
MTGKLPTGSAEETRDWFSLLDAIEEIAGNDVPCRNYPDLFFQELVGRDAVTNQKIAKDMCGQCPIVKECLAFAMKHEQQYGIWGGLSPYERRLLKNKNK